MNSSTESPRNSSLNDLEDQDGTSDGTLDTESDAFEELEYEEGDDDEYEDDAANPWPARILSRTRLLYQHLFIIQSEMGNIETPPRDENKPSSLLRLPLELRNRIYEYYFRRPEDPERPEEHGSFPNDNGKELQRIILCSENLELKFWLSSGLLQTSRQLRFEAMYILFENCVLTVDWLPVLPRVVEFLGRDGCAMVRNLDLWDPLSIQSHESASYRDIIASISHFPDLRHLRIGITWGRPANRVWSTQWFDADDWAGSEVLKQEAMPKMRFENPEKNWPEYNVLMTLKARKFTLAMGNLSGYGCLEFDRSFGAYPRLINSIQSKYASKRSTPSLVPSCDSISTEVLDRLDTNESRPYSTVSTTSPESDKGHPDYTAWQDTDALDNKTIPFYNFVCKLLRNILRLSLPIPLPLWLSPPARKADVVMHNFATFPAASTSTGGIIRDCCFCYLSERHCGHHAVPNQHLDIPTQLEGRGKARNRQTPKERFEALPYVEMREACRYVVLQLDATGIRQYRHRSCRVWGAMPDSEVDDKLKEVNSFLVIQDHLGWFKVPNGELLAKYDSEAETGCMGEGIDKAEVPPWDMLYRAICLHFRKGPKQDLMPC
jgi:hypothetical protein